MSEEMNLYKRCKNIFKNHGVDMGGGESGIPEAPVDGKQYARKDGNWSEVVSGSDGGLFVVTISMDSQTEDMTADKSFNDIVTALESNQNVMAKLAIASGQESQLIGMYPFVAYENGNSIAFGYYYQGDIDGFALSVENDGTEDVWKSNIIPQPETEEIPQPEINE